MSSNLKRFNSDGYLTMFKLMYPNKKGRRKRRREVRRVGDKEGRREDCLHKSIIILWT